SPASTPRRDMSSEGSASDSASERPPERAAMQRALDLARRGWGRVAPNPLVGAVVLAGDSVVAEGHHAEYGGAHAEVVALEGAGVLRAKGVIVSIGLLAEAAAALNAPFLFAREQEERPFVALKLATSIDGRIADAAGSSRWVSGEAAREYVHWLRAGFDAIAVGGMTALRDNPQLTVRGPVTPRKPPLRVVFDRRAMLNHTADLVKTAREVPTWVMS